MATSSNNGKDSVPVAAGTSSQEAASPGSQHSASSATQVVVSLHQAMKRIDVETAKSLMDQLLASKPDCLKDADRFGNTCVHYASHTSDHRVVIEVVNRAGAASLFWKNNEGQTPLHLAALKQSSSTLLKLFDVAQASCSSSFLDCVKLADEDGDSCLHFAARNASAMDAMLQLSSKAGVDSLFWKNNRGQTPMHLAIFKQAKATVMALLELVLKHSPDGASCLKAVDNDGNTCVHFAAGRKAHGRALVVELVERVGAACLGWKDNRRQTPLHIAAWNQSADTVAALAAMAVADNPSCLWIQDENGNTFVHSAAWLLHDDTTVLRVVQQAGADILLSKDYCNKTPLHLAVQRRSPDTAAALIRMVVQHSPESVQMCTKSGDSFMHLAASNTTIQSMASRVLAEVGIGGLYWKNKTNCTPLHKALQYLGAEAALELAEKALEHRPDVLSLADKEGDTCVHFAAKNSTDNDVVLKVAVLAGAASLSWANKKGQTPLHLAARHQGSDAVSQLLDMALSSNHSSSSDCLKLQDEDGCTFVHFAAGKANDRETLIPLLRKCDVRSLCRKNNSCQTPLHLAAEHQTADVVVKLLEKSLECDPATLSMSDQDGNTCVHFAAKNTKDSDVIMKLVAAAGTECLSWTNEHQQTPLHLAVQHQNAAIVGKLVDLASGSNSGCLTQKDDDGNNCVHAAAEKALYRLTIIELTQRTTNAGILFSKNTKGQTPLHLALQHQDTDTVETLVSMALKEMPECLRMQDNDGDTCVHFAARNTKSARIFVKVLEKTDHVGLAWLNRNSESPLQVALQYPRRNGWFQCLSSIVQRLADGTLPRELCTEQCPLLHSLFAPKFHHYEFNSSSFTDRNKYEMEYGELIKLIVKMGVDPAMENDLGENFLHSIKTMPWWLVRGIVHIAIRDAEIGSILKQALYSPQGLHAVHALSRRFSFHWLKTLARLSGMSKESLLRLRVAKGPFAGATCLHFACEAGHRENIRCLLERGLALSDETATGRSCLDFGYDKDKFSEICDAVRLAEVPEVDLLPLVDPPKRALRLPTASAARKTLAMITDAALISEAEKSQQERQGTALIKDSQSQDAMTILHKAFTRDSKDILRCALRLNLLNPRTERSFPQFFRDTLEEANRKKKEMGDDASCPGTDCNAADLFQLEDVSMLEFAVDVEKINILPDLLLTRQCDLIPCGIHLITQLTAQVAKRRGQHEQLRKLCNKIVAIVTNCLDGLFLNANADEKDWLFAYIKGEFAPPQDTHSVQPVLSQPLHAINHSSSGGNQPQTTANHSSSGGNQPQPTANHSSSGGNQSQPTANPSSSGGNQSQPTANPSSSGGNQTQPAANHSSSGGNQSQPTANHSSSGGSQPQPTVNPSSSGGNQTQPTAKRSCQPHSQTAQSQPPNSQQACQQKSANKRVISGPRFPYRSQSTGEIRFCSVLELIEESQRSELLATECLHNLVCKDWLKKTPDAALLAIKMSARDKFRMYAVFFVLFIAVFAYYITSSCLLGARRAPTQELAFLVVLSCYAASFTTQEVDDFLNRRRLRTYFIFGRIVRLPAYFNDRFNTFDWMAIATIWIGIALSFAEALSANSDPDMRYTSKMFLSTSFLLWGFRSVAFLYYSARIGPVVSILGSLLIKDLLPFLALLAVIVYSFGVFYFTLLFPIDSANQSTFIDVTVQTLSMPFYMMFGFFEKFDFQRASSTELNASDIEIGKRAHPMGIWWFYNILIFAFLFLVNVVMVNLLIALFSLTVNRKSEKAQVIWRKMYYVMLLDYRNASLLPPPFSFAYYCVKWIKCRRHEPFECVEKEAWWSSDADRNAPPMYTKFLQFQARCLRSARPKLLLGVPQHLSELGELRGQTEQLLAVLEAGERTRERQEEQLAVLQESLDELRARRDEAPRGRPPPPPGELSELSDAVQSLRLEQTAVLHQLSRLVEKQDELQRLMLAKDSSG